MSKRTEEDKFPIVVTEDGLHICVDDILTPTEGMELISEVQWALLKWRDLTGKAIDVENDPLRKRG